VKARVGHALFALILTGSVLTNARPDDPPAEPNQLAAAIIDVARSNDLSFRGQTTLANLGLTTLAFDAKGCREPITVALLSIDLEQLPWLRTINPENQTLHIIYYARRWREPDRVSIFWEQKKQQALAVVGLTSFVPSPYLLAIMAPTGCNAADTIDWRQIWDRRYLGKGGEVARIRPPLITRPSSGGAK
jgi:hypothetical protein